MIAFAESACHPGGVLTESIMKPVQTLPSLNYRYYISAECKDERDCSWIETELAKYGGSLADYCELYKDTAPIKQCRKTCKMCK